MAWVAFCAVWGQITPEAVEAMHQQLVLSATAEPQPLLSHEPSTAEETQVAAASTNGVGRACGGLEEEEEEEEEKEAGEAVGRRRP